MNQLVHHRFVTKTGNGIVNGRTHLAGIECGKGKASSLSRKVVIGNDRVFQSTGFPHDGQAAVTHGNHLAQATGFKAGRHQEKVTPGVDLVGQLFVVTDVGYETAFIAFFHIAHIVFIAGIACTEEHKLERFVFHDILQHFHYQLKALLLRHACDHSKNRKIFPFFKPETLLKPLLALCLSASASGREMCGNQCVLCRIESNGINPVQNSAQIGSAGIQNGPKTFGIIVRFDFFRIGRADSADFIRKIAAGFQKIRCAPELHHF